LGSHFPMSSPLAEVLALVADVDVLARIGGRIGERARVAFREITTLDEKSSRAKRASWLAAARVPIPPDVRGIDRSWIEHAIANITTVPDGAVHTALLTRARRILLDGPDNATDVWLARWICASFPSMPPIDSTRARPRSIAEAVTMSAPALRAWLEEVGADQIAFAIGKSAISISTRLDAAAARIVQAPRLGELGERRAAIERARITIDESALLRVGARTIAPLPGALERLQIAHRLPREAGVMQEMEAFAGSAGAPSWRALAAP
jgi:hypothetical protein